MDYAAVPRAKEADARYGSALAKLDFGVITCIRDSLQTPCAFLMLCCSVRLSSSCLALAQHPANPQPQVQHGQVLVSSIP